MLGGIDAPDANVRANPNDVHAVTTRQVFTFVLSASFWTKKRHKLGLSGGQCDGQIDRTGMSWNAA